MPDETHRRNNVATWWGLVVRDRYAGLLQRRHFFVGAPFQAAITWLSLLLAAVALIFLVIGVRRAIVQPEVYRGKALTVVLTVVALLPAGLSALGGVGARKLPGAAAAPQVGQKVPDFTLVNSTGKPVSLDQLLAASSAGATCIGSAQGGVADFLPRLLVTVLQPRVTRCGETASGVRSGGHTSGRDQRRRA